MAVASEGKRLLKVGFPTLEVALDLGEAAAGIVDLEGQPLLLALQQLKGDRVGVMGLKQLLALTG